MIKTEGPRAPPLPASSPAHSASRAWPQRGVGVLCLCAGAGAFWKGAWTNFLRYAPHAVLSFLLIDELKLRAQATWEARARA